MSHTGMDTSVVHPCHLTELGIIQNLPKPFSFGRFFFNEVCFEYQAKSLSSIRLISLPLVIMHGGQVLEAMLGDNWLTHRAGLNDCKAISTFTDLFNSCGQQTGVQPLLAIF